nr:STAS domain-containing protein [Planosporangium thailandense]
MVTDDRVNGATVVALVGQLDLDTAPLLYATFERLRARSVTRVVVDLGALTYCDSTGLSALALASNHCVEAGGYLRLAVLNPFVLQLVTALGIARTVPIYRTVDAALAGDLDGLVAVSCRQSPWTVPSQPGIPNRRLAVASTGRGAPARPNVAPHARRPVPAPAVSAAGWR